LRDIDALNALRARNYVILVERDRNLEFITYRITPFGEDYFEGLQTPLQPTINIGSFSGLGIAGN